jgi:hypothetical protein
MENFTMLRLNLRAPLFYRENTALVPFPKDVIEGEQLFCFGLEHSISRSIEPSPAAYLGPLLFGGTSAADCALQAAGPAANGAETGRETPDRPLELPAGDYLFAQERNPLGREAFIALAIEVQKEGLWEREEPEDRLYLRYVFEDGRTVTQVFRPYKRAASTM